MKAVEPDELARRQPGGRGWTPWCRVEGHPRRRVRFYIRTTSSGPVAIRTQTAKERGARRR